MEEEKQEGFLSDIRKVKNAFFNGVVTFVWVIIYTFIVGGSAAAIILLIKLYPEQAQILLMSIRLPVKIIMSLLFICLEAWIVTSIVYWVIRVRYPIMQQKRKERRELFKTELKKEILKEVKVNGGRTRISHTNTTKQSR